MMKYKFYLLIFVFSLYFNGFYAQNITKSFSIQWNNNKEIYISSINDKFILPIPEHGSVDENMVPYFFEQWIVPNKVQVKEYAIVNKIYVDFDVSYIKGINLNRIPSQIKSSFVIKNARLKSYAQIKIYPLIYVNGKIKKLVSFNLSYQLKTIINFSKTKKSLHNSKFASGDWYKFSIDTTGVYKLSKTFLENIGVNINDINPKNLQLYGNGGAMLPELNSEFRPDGLQENAIYISGENDESFDDKDYILFYGQGPDTWITNQNLTNAHHQNNIYSDKAFFFIHVGNEQGKRIQQRPQLSNTLSDGTTITSYNAYAIHELEEINLDHFGQQFFGEAFNIADIQNFTIPFNDVDLSYDINVKFSVGTKSNEDTIFKLRYNNQDLISQLLPGASGIYIGKTGIDQSSFTPLNENLEFEVIFDNLGEPSARGFLDYIEVNGIKKLVARGKQFSFRNFDLAKKQDTQIEEYIIENKSNIFQIWEVTDRFNPQIIKNNSSSLSDFSFLAQGGILQEFILLNKNDFYIPQIVSDSHINNQNLHIIKDIDYLIVTQPELISQAERLALFHHKKGLSTLVLTEQEIYNEYSSASKDPVAIRDFIKQLYFNASNSEKRIKYVLMFGDTSFDFKNIEKQNRDINVISYQSKNSINLAASYVTDDFFVMLDDNEGEFFNFNGGGDLIDVAISRIPVKNFNEAKLAIDKILNYYSKNSLGNWRNKITFLADDVDISTEIIFMKTEEHIANMIKQYKPVYNVIKIYADAYVQQNSSGGESYPQVEKLVDETIERGTLILNYFGHGGENGLGHERYVDNNQLKSWNNYNTSPLFITITCEISRFDNPIRVSGGESLFLNKTGGSINMISTSREIYISTGATFNERLIENILEYNTDDNLKISESLLKTKNINPTDSQRLFIQLFGDPAMRLAKPKPNIKLTYMNDVDISQELDTIKALSHVYFKGIVTDKNNNLLSDFNGDLSITVYDKITIRQTLNNDGECDIIDFDVRDSKIFNGKATVVNGEWQFDFIAPRDIRIAYGSAKLSFYADNQVDDKNGYNTDVIIGGINYDAPEDNIGPIIKLYMNDESFIDGGNTNESPLFLAVLEDDSGINTSFTAVDHDIVAILDGDQSNPIIMNDYFETEANNFKKGKVNYPFKNLEVGLHTLTFKCWDTYNNPSESSLSFVVVSDSELVLENVLNYPNPFINYTEFWFTHNKPNEALEAQIQIFTVSGKLIKTINQQVLTNGTLSRTMTWNGLDDFGNKIGKGVYIYKLKVKVVSSGLKSEKIEKLVILQ